LRRNCLLKHVIERKREGGIEVARRRGKRRKQEKALHYTPWRILSGRRYGPVEGQTTGCVFDKCDEIRILKTN
jgi:hypothetical protein